MILRQKRGSENATNFGNHIQGSHVFYRYCTGSDIEECEGWLLLHVCSSLVALVAQGESSGFDT